MSGIDRISIPLMNAYALGTLAVGVNLRSREFVVTLTEYSKKRVERLRASAFWKAVKFFKRVKFPGKRATEKRESTAE